MCVLCIPYCACFQETGGSNQPPSKEAQPNESEGTCELVIGILQVIYNFFNVISPSDLGFLAWALGPCSRKAPYILSRVRSMWF